MKAADTINGVHMDITAVAKEAEAVGNFLDDMATSAKPPTSTLGARAV
jgi:hypothetical protein